MELLRKCSCPVLLSSHGRPASRLQIVAAVNASTEEPEEQALNEKIVDLALLMALHLEAGPPKLLQVWTPVAEQMIRSHSGDDEFASYVDGARQRAAADLARLLRRFEGRLGATPSSLRQGEPEDVIPELSWPKASTSW
jgi:hypothetical protein